MMIQRVLQSRAVLFALLMASLLYAPLLYAQRAVRPTDHPFLYRIEATSASYIYGTIHLPDDRVLAVPPVVMEALRSSDIVCTEIPMDPATQMKLGTATILTDGKTLEDLLPPKLYRRTVTYASSKGLPALALNQQKVWAAATTLSLLDYLQEMMSKPLLDQYLYQAAVKLGKEQDALETAEEQIGILDSLSLESQIEMLSQTLVYLEKSASAGKRPLEDLVVTYLGGDEEKLMNKAFEYLDPNDPLSQQLLDAIITKRNRNMAERIAAKLEAKPGRSQLFVLGALHLPQDDGVIALLRKSGLTVERVR